MTAFYQTFLDFRHVSRWVKKWRVILVYFIFQVRNTFWIPPCDLFRKSNNSSLQRTVLYFIWALANCFIDVCNPMISSSSSSPFFLFDVFYKSFDHITHSIKLNLKTDIAKIERSTGNWSKYIYLFLTLDTQNSISIV